MHRGEVGIEIAPLLAPSASPSEQEVARRVDELLRRTCDLARALAGAEQAALNLTLDGDPATTRKYFSMSAKYEAWRDYRVDPKGLGLHGLSIPPGTVVRLTQEEVERHPAWLAFGEEAERHPPMRGWLAVSVCGDGGYAYGLLQLSDKSDGSDFTEEDGERVLELSHLAGAMLDVLRARP